MELNFGIKGDLSEKVKEWIDYALDTKNEELFNKLRKDGEAYIYANLSKTRKMVNNLPIQPYCNDCFHYTSDCTCIDEYAREDLTWE